MSKEKIVNTSGKRKRAIARATVKKGKGIIRINKRLLDNWGGTKYSLLKVKEALMLVGDISSNVNISVDVTGGGINSQAEAVRLAIATGLVEFSNDKKLKETYLDYDRHLIVPDVRRREASKPNNSHPRAKRQKSYR